MSAKKPAIDGIVEAARARRLQLVHRVLCAALVGLTISRLIGWEIAIPWCMAYVLAQAPELLLFGPVNDRKVERIGDFRATLGVLAVALSSAVFGSLSYLLWTQGGAFGGVCALLLLAGAIMQALCTTPGSASLLGAALIPQFLFLLATPMYIPHATREHRGGAIMAILFFCGVSLALWRRLESARREVIDARLEAERARDEAEAATAAKSLYVATIGHELRTPIGAMLAGAVELERTAKGPLLRPHATLIADAGRMMRTLLDDVLDHAKLEAGRMSIEAVPFDLRAMLAQTVRFWQSEARKKGLKLRVEGAAALPQWVEADPTRLRQIMNNLISNAVKFTDHGSISLRMSAWPSEDDSVAIRIQIIDTGAGMTAEQIGRLFAAFQQADKTVARNHGGTGLGLTISRQLARLMGGQLTAFSVQGEGSVFTLALTMPLAEPQVVAPAPVQAPAPRRNDRQLRVMIADDHEINRRAVQLILQPIGAEVVAVCDGKAAVEAAMKEPFDLIFMDVRMPELDGREATRQIRAEAGPNQTTPIIAVTADTDRDDVDACLQAGMNWFVGKPIEPSTLIETTSQALNEAAYTASLNAKPAPLEMKTKIAPLAAPVVTEAEDTTDDVIEADDVPIEGFAEEPVEAGEEERAVRILVADDHEINRRAVELILSPAGAEIVTVVDGRQAFEIALAEPFDVIIMDVRMPEMDGRESSRRIRATPGPNQTTPIIAVTADTAASDVEACKQAGMEYFVGKPIDAGRLLATVVEAIDNAAARNGNENQRVA
jgi:signal transduction histidine kinase/PleD family two-component response regulator